MKHTKQNGFALGYIVMGLAIAGIMGALIIGSMSTAKASTETLGKKMTTREYAKTALMTIRTSLLYEDTSALPEPVAADDAIEGGGLLPEIYDIRTKDGYGRTYAFCTNQAATKGQGRMAVVSAGANGKYESNCEQALSGQVAGDDVGAVSVDAEINDLLKVREKS